jgi:hypothetical protein
MVMSGLHCPISYFLSQEMEGDMEKKFEADHFFNEENLDTHVMSSPSHVDNLKLIYVDLDCPAISNYPSSSDIEQDYFPIFDRSFIKTSCSNDSYDLLLSSNHEYDLEDISNSLMV